jgi:hypothetical protein
MQMSKKAGRLLLGVLGGLFFFAGGVFSAPGDNVPGEGEITRGTIPEVLLRPQRGEAPRYPLDTVIGALGRGEAPEEAYLFAREAAAALIAGNLQAPSLQAMNSRSLESFISAMNTISPRVYRWGSGREEPDGAVSFLVRFLGRERGIAGELYIRRQEAVPSLEGAGGAGASDAASAGTAGPDAVRVSPDPAIWRFEDLILEEARERGLEDDHRFDFPPYERFF